MRHSESATRVASIVDPGVSSPEKKQVVCVIGKDSGCIFDLDLEHDCGVRPSSGAGAHRKDARLSSIPGGGESMAPWVIGDTPVSCLEFAKAGTSRKTGASGLYREEEEEGGRAHRERPCREKR